MSGHSAKLLAQSSGGALPSRDTGGSGSGRAELRGPSGERSQNESEQAGAPGHSDLDLQMRAGHWARWDGPGSSFSSAVPEQGGLGDGQAAVPCGSCRRWLLLPLLPPQPQAQASGPSIRARALPALTAERVNQEQAWHRGTATAQPRAGRATASPPKAQQQLGGILPGLLFFQ